ncbi:Uu.00g099460.m01.CDS01 [Anthostomella pinea]|uniref:Uu.00g099460.m01.CDS01 n=1 Tax=Anthostomella pinea TaxID=933095 RepID=A0AAI8VDC2_9PEZI|nr:Uu.00g099460.m01.CDS01 [Anthostomella pinea]
MIAETVLLAVALSAAGLRAQKLSVVDIYSASNCDPDPNDLKTQSAELSFTPNRDGNGNTYTACELEYIGLGTWPTNDDGKYQVWVDTSGFGEGCSMLFYNLLGSDEEFNEWPCRQLYRQIQADKTGCGDLDLTQQFGYAICNDDISSWPQPAKRAIDDITQDKRHIPSSSTTTKEKRDTLAAPVKDVIEVKRAPVYPKRDDKKCTLILDGKPFTTYGDQQQIGPNDKCELAQTTCGQDYTYTVSTEVADSASNSDSTTAGFEWYVTFSNTLESGYEHSETNSKSFSVTHHLAPEPGHEGYPTFQPLFSCAKAHLKGDCSDVNLSISGDTICVNKMISNGGTNEPDGDFLEVTID